MLTCKCGCQRKFKPNTGPGRKREFFSKACANRFRRGHKYTADHAKFNAGKISQADQDEMVNMYLAGAYSTEIASHFNVTKQTVSYYLNRLIPDVFGKYERDNQGSRQTRRMTAAILRLAKAAKLNNTEIAVYTQVPEPTVRRVLKNHNIPTAITNRKLWAQGELDRELPYPSKYQKLYDRLENLDVGDSFRLDCKDGRDCRIHQASLYRYSVTYARPKGWQVRTLKSKTNKFIRVFKVGLG